MSRAWILCASESRLPRAVSSKQTMQICYYHKFNPHPNPHHLHSFAPTTQVSIAVSKKLRTCYPNGICRRTWLIQQYQMQHFDLSVDVWVKKHYNSEMTRSSLFWGVMEHYTTEKRDLTLHQMPEITHRNNTL